MAGWVTRLWGSPLAREFAIEAFPFPQPSAVAEPTFPPSAAAPQALRNPGLTVGDPSGPDLVTALAQTLAARAQPEDRMPKGSGEGSREDLFARFARDCLPFLDAFERLLALAGEHAAEPAFEGWRRSLRALYDRLVALMRRYDFHVVSAIGQAVDFHRHHVLEVRRTGEATDQTVIAEARPAVIFRGELLRDAHVIVAHNPESSGLGRRAP